MGAKSLELCLTLCDPTDYSSVHGILRAKIMKWVAIPSYRGSSRPRDQIDIRSNSMTLDKLLNQYAQFPHVYNDYTYFVVRKIK